MSRLAFIAALGICSVASAADKPNIVVILADDLGYGSVAYYGGVGLKTPNIDRLAQQGRRFTDAYTPGSVCSPTRYGLLTGRYYWRTSVKDGEVLGGNSPLHIETDRTTLASLCNDQGYRTAAFGKWHLGLTDQRIEDWSVVLKPGPLEIGFDHFFGMGSNPWSGPHSFIEDHEVLGKVPGKPVVVSGRREEGTTSGIARQWDEHQLTRQLTEHASAWIEKNHDEPFFVYFAQTAVHRPVAPNPNFTGSQYGPYGDFIHELDWSVGRILDALDRTGEADDTLVIFTSDNGGVANENLKDEIGQARDAGLAINGALRGGKHDIWEGGFRVPFIVRWPGHVKAGTTTDAVICLTDLVATVASLLDVDLKPGHAEDSFDVGGAMFADAPSQSERDHIILQDANATYAIRRGNWKLVERTTTPPVEPRNRNAAARNARRRPANLRDELFNLAEDPAETRDVSDSHADVVKQLREQLIAARERGFTRLDAGN